MKLILKDVVFEIDREQFQSVQDMVKRVVKMGIYAVEKDGVVEMKNETFDSKEDLKKFVVEYEKAGFKVYYNS